MDPTRFLLRNEVQQVIADLKSRAGKNARQNLVIFRLSCGCGLRCKEIVGLEISDFKIGTQYPVLRIRRALGKGKKSRVVPLWWSAGTRADLLSWIKGRQGRVLTKTRAGEEGEPLSCHLVASRWKTAIRGLGSARVAQLSIHTGRHSFCTHALIAGRSLAEVRDAAGHGNVSITDVYLHAANSLNSTARDLYSETTHER